MSSNIPLLPPSPPATTTTTTTLSSGSVGGGGVEIRGPSDSSAHALRRVRYTQSRSVAIEESSPDDEDTEITPLIQKNVSNIHGSSGAGKS